MNKNKLFLQTMHNNVIDTLKMLEEVEMHEKQKTPLVERQMKKTNLLISQAQIFIQGEGDEDEITKSSLKDVVSEIKF
jgi:hypothetical protein